MKRFHHKQWSYEKKQIAAILLFLAMFGAFILGISEISSETNENQTETLRQAISRGITHCYATNGYYPENLDVLLDEYGITYDTDQYFVDYQVLGKNIFPDVTIMEK